MTRSAIAAVRLPDVMPRLVLGASILPDRLSATCVQRWRQFDCICAALLCPAGATLDADWRDDNVFATCSNDGSIAVCKMGSDKALKTWPGDPSTEVSGAAHCHALQCCWQCQTLQKVATCLLVDGISHQFLPCWRASSLGCCGGPVPACAGLRVDWWCVWSCPAGDGGALGCFRGPAGFSRG